MLFCFSAVFKNSFNNHNNHFEMVCAIQYMFSILKYVEIRTIEKIDLLALHKPKVMNDFVAIFGITTNKNKCTISHFRFYIFSIFLCVVLFSFSIVFFSTVCCVLCSSPNCLAAYLSLRQTTNSNNKRTTEIMKLL